MPDAFNLSSKQQTFFWDNRRFLAFIGGRGSGKSTAACMRIIGMIQRGELKHGARILVVGPDYTQLSDGTIKTFDKWFDAAGLTVHKVNGNAPRRDLVNGIEVMFRSGKVPEQTRSKETQLVWLDEAAQMDESVLTLTNGNQRQFGNDALYQTIITTTPRGKNWLYRRFGQQILGLKADSKVGAYRTSTMEAYKEGVVRQGYIEEFGYAPGSQMWQQELEADFVTWSGLVFSSYDYKKCTPDPFILPEFRRVHGGVDIGLTAPTVLLLVGEDKRGARYAFKEYYQRNARPHDWMAIAGEWHRDWKVRRWDVDAACRQEIGAMNASGVRAYPSIKKQDAANTAVSYINSLMDRGMFFISPECPFLISEVEQYEFKEQQSGDEVTFLDKVKPNQADHSIDAMRYCIMGMGTSRAAPRENDGWTKFSFARGAAA